MSASSKKKLRNEQNAAKLTERQLAEQKEAKKLKLYTITFVVVLVALLATAVTIGVIQAINTSGLREKNTVAMTVNGHEISNAELNYYYTDTVNAFYSQNGSYAAMFGLDPTKPLDQQVYDASTGMTWADYFLDSAKNTAKSIYALYDAAQAAGYEVTEEEKLEMEDAAAYAEMYANVYNYANANAFLKAMYGNGADEESYVNYTLMSMVANSYYNAYGESLSFQEADLRAAEAENFHKYSSFTYNYYYLPTSRFLEGGTTDESGNTTYSDDEKAASIKAAEEAAKLLTGEDITSVEALDAAIAALPANAGIASAVSTHYSNQTYSGISSFIVDWLTDDARTEGDLTYIANGTGDSITGYYIVYFHSVNDNTAPMKNVRHILVAFEGGTTDENGNTTYSAAEKDAAKKAAEELLNQWKSGEATEDSFAALATENTDDPGSSETGGLYENVYPGQMVPAFEEWVYDDARKVGDTGIVETEYGYHIMYFSGNSEVTYRDSQITNDLTNTALNDWYNSLIEESTIVEGDTRYVKTNMVLAQY